MSKEIFVTNVEGHTLRVYADGTCRISTSKDTWNGKWKCKDGLFYLVHGKEEAEGIPAIQAAYAAYLAGLIAGAPEAT